MTRRLVQASCCSEPQAQRRMARTKRPARKWSPEPGPRTPAIPYGKQEAVQDLLPAGIQELIVARVSDAKDLKALATLSPSWRAVAKQSECFKWSTAIAVDMV